MGRRPKRSVGPALDHVADQHGPLAIRDRKRALAATVPPVVEALRRSLGARTSQIGIPSP
jgi:hypothetical protein